MARRRSIVAPALWLVAAGAAAAPTPTPAPAPATLAALDCMIQPHQTVQLGTAAPGVVRQIHVERGDFVKRGQAVVQMGAEVERAALAVARERASQTGELAATRGAHELARREAQRAAELVDENFVSRTYFDKQRAEERVAAGRGEQAQERIQLARREVELASAQLAQRTVVAPIDGVVVERFVSPGEYVEQKPVLRIAAIDPLRVDVLVPAVSFGQVSVGAKASVVPELLSKQARVATVIGVDRVVDAASNTFRVRLELPNPGGALPPGLRCKADLGLRAGDTTPAATSTPSAPILPAAKIAPAAAAAPATHGAGTASQPTQAMVRRLEPVEPAQGRAPGAVVQAVAGRAVGALLPAAQAAVRPAPVVGAPAVIRAVDLAAAKDAAPLPTLPTLRLRMAPVALPAVPAVPAAPATIAARP